MMGEDSAFPFEAEDRKGNEGLTKREYFAALAMQALASNTELEYLSGSQIAEDAVKFADALIEELNK